MRKFLGTLFVRSRLAGIAYHKVDAQDQSLPQPMRLSQRQPVGHSSRAASCDAVNRITPSLISRSQRLLFRPTPRIAAPSKQLLWAQPVSACNRGHRLTAPITLSDNPRLLLLRSGTAPSGPGKHFQPANRLRLRLVQKLSVRHVSNPCDPGRTIVPEDAKQTAAAVEAQVSGPPRRPIPRA